MFRLLPVVFAGCLLLSSVPVRAADAISDVRAFYASTRTLQTEFRQLQIDEAGTVSQTLEGRFWMHRPQKLRWVYERPYRQLMVNDGNRFWLYDEDLAQVTVRPSAEALQNAPLLLLSGGPALEQQFELRSLPRESGLDWVEIRPRDDDSDFVTARMGLKHGLPAELDLRDSLGQRTRILFINLRQNPNLDSTRFRFDVPEGVEVIGLPEGN